MKHLASILSVFLFVTLLAAVPAEAGIISTIGGDIAKGLHHLKGDIESAADQVDAAVKKGLHDLSKLSAKAYDYVMKKLKELLADEIRKLEGADGYKPSSFVHHARKSGSGNIQIIASNSARITVIGGVDVGLKIGFKGFSHTFQVALGSANNHINYNSVIVPSTDVSGWDIYIDSTTSGTHHYIGINVNVASIILGN